MASRDAPVDVHRKSWPTSCWVTVGDYQWQQRLYSLQWRADSVMEEWRWTGQFRRKAEAQAGTGEQAAEEDPEPEPGKEEQPVIKRPAAQQPVMKRRAAEEDPDEPAAQHVIKRPAANT